MSSVLLTVLLTPRESWKPFLDQSSSNAHCLYPDNVPFMGNHNLVEMRISHHESYWPEGQYPPYLDVGGWWGWLKWANIFTWSWWPLFLFFKLGYNWRLTLYYFQVYDIVIRYLHTLWNDHHGKSSYHPLPYTVTNKFFSLWWRFLRFILLVTSKAAMQSY